jgi:hypothetical protein
MKQQSMLNDEKIVLAQSFNRSTNLELDFQDVKRLSDIYLPNKFLVGMNETLDSILTENSNQRVRVLSGSPGLGKSTYALLTSNLVSKRAPRVIKAKLEETHDTLKKDVMAKYEDFQKGKKTKLLPVFLNGYLGEIEDAFIEKLHSAFEREGLGKEFEKITSSSTKKYTDIIQKWKRSFPEVYSKYCKTVAEKVDDVEDFEKNLKKGKAAAVAIFQDIFGTITGGSSVESSNKNVIEVYKNALDVLAQNGWYGIFIVYDEFGKYLERGIHNPSSLNIQFLQDFAEFCDRSGERQCHLSLITHLSVSQYASQLPITVQKEWAKIEGRFHESAFYDRGTGHYEMISHVFATPVKETDPGLFKRVKKFNEAFLSGVEGKGLGVLFERKNPAELLSTCYPLHPLTLSMLPVISQKVAQNERTLYTFLTRDEENSLRRFIQTENIDDLNFLTPLHLYKYFAPLVAKDVGVGGSYKVNLMVEEAFGKIPVGDIMGREIISFIGLSSIIKNFNLFPLTKDFIVASFEGLYEGQKIEKKLKELSDLKLLYFNKILKHYELQQGSSVDIDEEIEKFRSVKLTGRDLVRIVKDYFPQDFIVPKRYNYDNAITRFAPVTFISVEELKANRFKAVPDYLREDALLYYVIPFDQEELLQARKIVSESSNQLVAFVLPNSFIECRKDIEELNAVNTLFNNKEVIQSGPLVKKELERHKNVTLTAIRSVLEGLVGKFQLSAELFYAPLEMRVSLKHYSELLIAIGKILEKEYHSYVILNSELVNKQKASGTISLARKLLIDALIAKGEGPKFGLENNGPEVSMLKSFQAMSGLKLKAGDLVVDKKSAFYRLFEDYKNWLESSEKGLSASEVYDRMIAPPYGIRRCVVPLYTSIFDQLLEYPVSHYYQGEYLQKVDGTHYEMMFKHPKDCRIKYTPINKTRAEYLNRLNALFGGSEKNVTVAMALQAVFKWRQSVPPYTKEHPELRADFKKLLIALDSASEPEKLLFEKFPESFGFEPVHEDSKPNEVTKLLEKIENAKIEIPKIYVGLISALNSSIFELLNFIQETCIGEKPISYSKGMNLSALFQATLSRFPAEVGQYPFNKLTADLLNRIKSFDSTKHPQYFVETMGDVLTKSNPRGWSEKGRSLFEANLLRCKTELEMVFELLSPNFKGKSVIAFINRQTGEKEYMRLGVVSGLKDSLNDTREQVEDLIKSLNHGDRNALLMSLLAAEADDNLGVGVKGLQGQFIK